MKIDTLFAFINVAKDGEEFVIRDEKNNPLVTSDPLDAENTRKRMGEIALQHGMDIRMRVFQAAREEAL